MKKKILLGKKFIFVFFLILYFKTVYSSQKNKPLIIAHRGASAYLPEHSLLAATAAHMENVDYIELDLVLTKDKIPIVLHDITLDKTTNIAKVFPKKHRKNKKFYALDFTLSEIKQLNTHERKNFLGKTRYPSRFPSTLELTKVASLDEMVDLIWGLNQSRKKNIGLYIEIKSAHFHQQEGFDIVKTVYDNLSLKTKKYSSLKIILQSFEKETLIRLKKEFKTKWPLVQLIYDSSWGKMPQSIAYDELKSKRVIEEISNYADGLGPWITSILSETKSSQEKSLLMQQAKEKGLKIHPYTFRKDDLPPKIKSEKELVSFLFKVNKFDGIFTDFPNIKIY